MQFHRENNEQTKKPQELVWKFIEKHMKIHGTKVPWPATKEDKCCFFMIAKSLAGVNKNNLYKTRKYIYG